MTSTCGSRVITPASAASDALLVGHPGQHVQGGEDAVAGGRVAAHDHVAGLLAAEGVAEGLHRLEDVAVADLGLPHADALGAHRLDEAEVAHHRGHDGVGLQGARVAHREGEHREELVAVDDVALVVDRQAPVGVAVEREADVGAVLERPRAGARRGAWTRSRR